MRITVGEIKFMRTAKYITKIRNITRTKQEMFSSKYAPTGQNILCHVLV
jgi:hypothetical protein